MDKTSHINILNIGILILCVFILVNCISDAIDYGDYEEDKLSDVIAEIGKYFRVSSISGKIPFDN